MFSPWDPPSTAELDQQTFAKLNEIRHQKKTDIYDLLIELRQKAFAIKQDEEMYTYFKAITRGRRTSGIEYEIDITYIERYGDFYDILFVDLQGKVCHSIKKESDYNKNLFSPPFTNSELSRTLRGAVSGNFAEFQYYPPSAEPAAFFTVQLEDMDQPIGWFVLQVAANSLNSVLTNRTGLGKTGEVYLVNKQKKMLTDSRFFQRSTILRQTIATEAVNLAFKNGNGEKIIHDYRGTPVYSSFEKLKIFGKEWVLITEIDEDEVLTEIYRKFKTHFFRELLAFIDNRSITRTGSGVLISDSDIRVDMNEYQKNDEIKRLATYGVATCTAVAATYPGKFGYLAHISPIDEIYMQDWYSNIGFGKNYFNLLGELFRHISYYDIYPSELGLLNVVIVVPHQESVLNTIDTLLDQGLGLSNIKIMYNKEALSANVLLDTDTNLVQVEWTGKTHNVVEWSTDVNNLAIAMKEILNRKG